MYFYQVSLWELIKCWFRSHNYEGGVRVDKNQYGRKYYRLCKCCGHLKKVSKKHKF